MKSEVKMHKEQFMRFQGQKVQGEFNFSNLTEYKSSFISERYSFKFVVDGIEEYIIDNEKQVLSSGQFLIVKPWQNVSVKINKKTTAQGICIYFSPKYFENKLAGAGNDQVRFPNFPIDVKKSSIEVIYNSLAGKESIQNSDFVLENCLSQFTSFLKTANSSLDAMLAKAEKTKIGLWEKIERGRGFIHRHFGTKITLENIASASYLSPFHFQRTFRSFYKMTPAEYLYKIRMEHAKKLILDYKITIGNVATECGFEDLKYFKVCLRKSGVLKNKQDFSL